MLRNGDLCRLNVGILQSRTRDKQTGRGETFSTPRAAGQPAKVSQIISALSTNLFRVLYALSCLSTRCFYPSINEAWSRARACFNPLSAPRQPIHQPAVRHVPSVIRPSVLRHTPLRTRRGVGVGVMESETDHKCFCYAAMCHHITRGNSKHYQGPNVFLVPTLLQTQEGTESNAACTMAPTVNRRVESSGEAERLTAAEMPLLQQKCTAGAFKARHAFVSADATPDTENEPDTLPPSFFSLNTADATDLQKQVANQAAILDNTNPSLFRRVTDHRNNSCQREKPARSTRRPKEAGRKNVSNYGAAVERESVRGSNERTEIPPVEGATPEQPDFKNPILVYHLCSFEVVSQRSDDPVFHFSNPVL
ncbi:hypothetical protein Baya_16150 [Bagarius yarrelli]|uniref:Uncharacterized protein n=1 Tax=Bagarius yarrelli TaxID=175774 RepID=A0A556VUJ2_BAGYA|nr:hypothetical protein Baya_16150 [Bagarius yarrelli]